MPLITIIINAKYNKFTYLRASTNCNRKDWTTQLVTRIFTMYLGQEVLKKRKWYIYINVYSKKITHGGKQKNEKKKEIERQQLKGGKCQKNTIIS